MQIGPLQRDGRKTYDTTFNLLYELLCDQPSPRDERQYDPTVRGLCKVLGIDQGTFQNYRTGKWKVPTVVHAHMNILQKGADTNPDYWEDVELLKIDTVRRKMEDTEQFEEVYQIEFNDGLGATIFHVRKFRLRINIRFREMLFTELDLITPPVKKQLWHTIIERALNGGYIGFYARKRRARRNADSPDGASEP